MQWSLNNFIQAINLYYLMAMNDNSLESCTFIVSNELERRVCVKFRVQLDKSTIESFEMIFI